MPRILVDLPEEDIRWLDRQAQEQGCSRAALLRDAVAAYRDGSARKGIEAWFGIWKDREDLGDAVDWQRRERAAASRAWDADAPDIAAEFPDLAGDPTADRA